MITVSHGCLHCQRRAHCQRTVTRATNSTTSSSGTMTRLQSTASSLTARQRQRFGGNSADDVILVVWDVVGIVWALWVFGSAPYTPACISTLAWSLQCGKVMDCTLRGRKSACSRVSRTLNAITDARCFIAVLPVAASKARTSVVCARLSAACRRSSATVQPAWVLRARVLASTTRLWHC